MGREGILNPDEKGSVLVVVLIFLLLLTIVAIAATTTSTIENQIVLNEKKSRENFYAAEACAMEAAQRLENATDKNSTWAPGTGFDIENPATWQSGSIPSTEIGIIARRNEDGKTDPQKPLRYRIEEQGIAKGETLIVSGEGESRLYNFSVNGLYNGTRNNGQATVELGYRKRF